MDLKNKIYDNIGNIIVEVEGFFIERFINLCKINNIHISNVTKITSGLIRFNINMNEFKKIKPFIKKTKCKLKIKRKKGIYFTLFKYRKRKYIFIMIILIIGLVSFSNSFIWKINTNIEFTEEIKNRLNNVNVNIGKFIYNIDENKLVKDLRAEFTEYSWIGVNIEGGHINLEFKEKIIIQDHNIQETRIGDIYANKSGILIKIIPEKGTAIYKEGSYIEEGMKLIEGKMHSQYIGEVDMVAKGIVRIKSDYIFEKKYTYVNIEKEYIENKYNIGFSIDSNEFCINYLNNNEKYDKIKQSISFNFFSKNISFDYFKYKKYIEKESVLDENQINEIFKQESNEYINKIMNSLNTPKIISENTIITKQQDGIIIKKIYSIDERIGVFKER